EDPLEHFKRATPLDQSVRLLLSRVFGNLVGDVNRTLMAVRAQCPSRQYGQSAGGEGHNRRKDEIQRAPNHICHRIAPMVLRRLAAVLPKRWMSPYSPRPTA